MAVQLSIFGLTICLLFNGLIEGRTIDKYEHRIPWKLEELHVGLRSVEDFWLPDNKYLYSVNNTIKVYDASTGKIIEDLSNNNNTIKVYDASTGKIIEDLSKEQLINLSLRIGAHKQYYEGNAHWMGSTKECDMKQYSWLPVKNLWLYTKDNDIYLKYANGLPVKITRPDTFKKGDKIVSLQPSKSDTKLAVYTANISKVKTHKWYEYGRLDKPNDQYAEEKSIPYTKVGGAMPSFGLYILDLESPHLDAISLKPPVDVVGADFYLRNPTWLNETHLLVVYENRRQNVATMQLCSTKGQCRELRRFEEPSGWITALGFNPLLQPICTSNGKTCFFVYWSGNWEQIWRLDIETGQQIAYNMGNFSVLSIYGYDEANDKIYYLATLPNDPAANHIFSNEYCLSCNVQDKDPHLDCQYARALFSKDFTYYALTCQGPNVPFVKIVRTEDNTVVYDVELNKEHRNQMAKHLQPIIKYNSVILADGSSGFAKILLPPNFDESKKYPLLFEVYGGPTTVLVTKKHDIDFGHYLTTNYDVIYVSIDGRGTENKGKAFHFSVNNHLGDYEVEDQLFAARWLQNSSFIDNNRTGIWGHSYGGYMVTKVIEADNDLVFKCGAAGAPVINWALYDNVYTEQYMGIPSTAEREEAYKKSSALNNLENIGTHDFLLMHGSADDNVHLEHSYVLAKKLQDMNIPFEEMIYVDQNHGLSNHKYIMMERFFKNCLNLESNGL
ncbi:venom dipeptidyl peptidase 4-like [Scaptodrosophila lebanonensis]|uniref:Venom dipeptidyl peptidase 4 n=1 Tax=Drosophila lebanonensis TaxID=7225 RepID=A0A6J2T291_DROLE|nr:venom dipeptidyl peptidase 4-like [Scaptodrosophila lebanonensis]